MMALSRQKADCSASGKAGEPYDALLDEYEPGMTAKQIEASSRPSARLTDLIKRVARRAKPRSTPRSSKSRSPPPSSTPSASRPQGHGLRPRRRPPRHHHPPLLRPASPRRHPPHHPLPRRASPTPSTAPCTRPATASTSRASPSAHGNFAPRCSARPSPTPSPSASTRARAACGRTSSAVPSKHFWKWAIPVAKKHYGKSVRSHRRQGRLRRRQHQSSPASSASRPTRAPTTCTS
jgi:hypothetical protein